MKFKEFLYESKLTTPDFEVSVDFGDGKFKSAGSFHSEQAAAREGRKLCTTDGSGKRYKVTNAVTGKSETYDAPSSVKEAESNYVAMSAYKANAMKVQTEIDKLEVNLMRHKERYLGTNRSSWGFSGDLEHVVKQLEEINDFLGSSR